MRQRSLSTQTSADGAKSTNRYDTPPGLPPFVGASGQKDISHALPGVMWWRRSCHVGNDGQHQKGSTLSGCARMNCTTSGGSTRGCPVAPAGQGDCVCPSCVSTASGPGSNDVVIGPVILLRGGATIVSTTVSMNVPTKLTLSICSCHEC